MREREIQFSRWIYHKEKIRWTVFLTVLFSILFHVGLFFLLKSIGSPEIVQEAKSPASISVHFNEPPINNTKEKHPIKDFFFPKKKKILTDNNKNSKSPFVAPAAPKPNVSQIAPQEKVANKQEKEKPGRSLSDFMPNANSSFAQSMQRPPQQNDRAVNDAGGDMPTEGPSLEPSNGPRIIKRFEEKDMGLFQFNQEFRERFANVWNSKDRILPPTSPLRPGDLVYYKVFVNSSGKLVKYENLSRMQHPELDYSDAERIFSEVLNRTLPINVPPEYEATKKILAVTIAIQVVGPNGPVMFSF